MSERLRKLLSVLILLILPALILISSLFIKIENVWFYVLSISWFCLGLLIYASIEDL